MLGRLVVKMLFKACVPLVAVAGVMTYGVYLKGGDPAGLWKHVASGAFGKAGDMFTQAKSDATGLAGNLSGNGSAFGESMTKSGSTEVFTWKDASGVTHFGTLAPADISAKKITVDPNVNVIVPVVATKSKEVYDKPSDGFVSGSAPPKTGRSGSRTGGSNEANQSVRQLEAEMGEPLPGVAGQLLSGGGASGNGLDTSQLIRLLQSADN